jgi:hypothetical protein
VTCSDADLEPVCRGSGSPPGGGLAQQAQARAQLQLEAAGLNALCSATIAAAAAAHPSAANSHAGYSCAAAGGLPSLETLCEPSCDRLHVCPVSVVETNPLLSIIIKPDSSMAGYKCR